MKNIQATRFSFIKYFLFLGTCIPGSASLRKESPGINQNKIAVNRPDHSLAPSKINVDTTLPLSLTSLSKIHGEPIHAKNNKNGNSFPVTAKSKQLGNILHNYARITDPASRSPITSPLKQSANPNYFQDGNGKPLVLCASQTWNTLQDWGTNGKVQPVNFDHFIEFLESHGHNFTLLWFVEQPVFRDFPTTPSNPPDFTAGPFPWKRTGPGLATDGGLKFDLSKFDETYFERLRTRAHALNEAGIYAGIYLFTVEFIFRFRFPGDGYAFSGPNNINGIDDGYRGGSYESGLASFTMKAPNDITALQDAYVKKVIDLLNDLPNILWISSEEAPGKSTWWNDHLVSFIRNYEKKKPLQHPVGYAVLADLADSVIVNSDADWIAPAVRISPARSCGKGKPACKVNINDSDHSYFGMWNDSKQTNRNYAWENFANGNQVLFMDPYLVYYPRQNRNRADSVVNGIMGKPDPRWENFRDNLGYILEYSRKLNLANVRPMETTSSTGFCLAQTPATGAEYLVYAPDGGDFTVNLSAMPATRKLAVTWFNPATGSTISHDPVASGSASHLFTTPFEGDAVLYLVDTEGHK